jgi:type II secretory pathway pseudopilin PulG
MVINNSTSEKGFTVIEVLIGIGIFALVVPSIIIAIVSLNQLNDRAADLTYANTIAERKIESLRSAGYNSMINGVYDFTNELTPTFTAPRQANYEVSTPENGIKEIVVNIKYTQQGILRELQYKSLISELGVAQ